MEDLSARKEGAKKGDTLTIQGGEGNNTNYRERGDRVPEESPANNTFGAKGGCDNTLR